MSPALAVGSVIILQLCSGLLDARRSLGECDRRSTATLAICAVLTVPAGVLILRALSPDAARLTIAAVTIIALLVLATGWQKKSGAGLRYTVPFGLAAGIFGGSSAMPRPPIIAYYMSMPVEPKAARASMNLIFVATGFAAFLTGCFSGLIRAETLMIFFATSPLMFIGTRLGGQLFHIAPARLFRPIGLVSLALGASLAAGRALL
jgi:uncharacterized membrane protein YfcA